MASSCAGAPPLLHLGNHSGHRGEYEELLAPLFRLKPVTGKVRFRNIMHFLQARSVLFGTIEDHYFGFVMVAFLRALLGRRTVGLFLRPQTCFKTDGSLRRTWKGWFFSALKQVPGISVGTIIPFAFAPHYSQVARFGVMDPHMWDKGEPASRAQDGDFANILMEQAQGRPILAFIGTVTPIKGVEFLVSLLTQPDWPKDRLFVVIAGKVAAKLTERLQGLSPSRVMVIDRKISDVELDTLYSCSEWIWACYRPDYDQASGIFGRSVQFRKIAVIRRGTLLDQMATNLGLECIRLDFEETRSAIETLVRFQGEGNAADVAMVARWKDEFAQTIEALL